jgi:D-alanyl-lipoteichoic acid acyltransferase DltB (MBOAT superfamily)
MNFMGVNLVAVLLAAMSTMVLGFLWYSPLLFARPWMSLMGYAPDDKAKQDEMRKGAGKLYAISFLASLVAAFVLARIVRITSVHTVLHGARTGAGVWLGFVTTVQLTDTLFGKRPTKLYLINTGYQLVCYMVMGAILAAWPAV